MSASSVHITQEEIVMNYDAIKDVWRLELERVTELNSDNKEYEFVVPYHAIAYSFPGEVQPDSLEIPKIDWPQFSIWASRSQWKVIEVPDETPEVNKSTPYIKFAKIR